MQRSREVCIGKISLRRAVVPKIDKIVEGC
jgi:hypothetical protein